MGFWAILKRPHFPPSIRRYRIRPQYLVTFIFAPYYLQIAESVVVDGNLVTSQGVGTAFAFALKLIELLVGDTVAKSVADRALIPYP